MAKISSLSSYPLITNLDKDDYVIITDKENQLMTKNVSVEQLQTFFGINTNVKKVSISAANLLTSFSTPVEVIPQPGANQVLDIISIMAYLDAGLTVFNFPANVQLNIGAVNIGLLRGAQFLNQNNDLIEKSKLLDGVSGGLIAKGAGLNLQALTGNPTQGNGTLYLDVMYRVLDVGTSF